MIKNQWYLACFESELKTNTLLRRKIVGEELVIFKNNNAKLSILEDRCCHRNVHLSLGRVQNENLKCGYHGWEFNTEGKCVHIPMSENTQQIPPSACIKSYPFQIKYRAIWVYIGVESKMSEAVIPEMEELNHYPFVFNSHRLKANIKLVAESLFDAQHINHVHRKSIDTLLGKMREPKTDFQIEIKDKSLHGSYLRINDSSIFEKIYFGWQANLETKFSFWFPHSSKLDSYFSKHLHFPERRLVIYEHFYEIEEDEILMIQITTWKNIFRFNPPFAKWFMKRKSDQIVSEDILFLESNKHWHNKKSLNDLIIKGDEPTLSFLQLWNKNFKENYEKLD